MTNMLTLVKRALATWRKYNGNETLYYKCQWFDGWYMDWAASGFSSFAEHSLAKYSTALIAANNTAMDPKITHVNDPDLLPGMRLYFKYGAPGHVVTFIGWHGNRALVTQTANDGDTVIKLSNNLKICHADTINLKFIGASLRNGRNKPLTGYTAYIHGKKSVAKNPTKNPTKYPTKILRVASNSRTTPTTSGKIGTVYPAGKKLVVDTYKTSQEVTVAGVKSKIWFGIKGTGQYVAAACFTDQSTVGLKNNGTYVASAPKVKKRYVRLHKAWYVYRKEADAKTGRGYSDSFMLPKGDYLIVDQTSDLKSPFRVESDELGRVYVGTTSTSPTVVKK